jgi:phosphoglycerate dehydrogenase-like enzyme
MPRMDAVHIHFETRANKPQVFHITEDLIQAAKQRHGFKGATTLGSDLADVSWLDHAHALVTSNDVIRDAKFPVDRLGAGNLRWIHIIGAGIEPLLPLDWLPSGVTLTNNSGVHAEKVRESATMVLLMLNARLPTIVTNQRNGVWNQIFTPTIKNKVVLIVGVGEMGGAVAAAARGLGLRVLGIRRSGLPHAEVDEMFAIDQLDGVLGRADFVVLALPLTAATRGLMDRRRLERMKHGAALCNLGRAGLLDHLALLECLEEGRISGAVLDVFEPEPLDRASPLWHAKNLVLTPHVTSDDLAGYLPKTLDLVFENARRLVHGQALRNVVDRAHEY